MTLRFHAATALRRGHWAILGLGLGWATGAALLHAMPPAYRAEAVMLVEAPANDPRQTAAPDHLRLVQQRTLTRDSLLALASRTGQVQPADPASRAEAIRSAIRILPDAPPVTNQRMASVTLLVRVAFTADDGATAARMANAVAETMLREDGALRQAARLARIGALRQDSARLETALSRAESALVAFRRAHQGALPDNLDFRRNRQAVAEASLVRLEDEMTALRDDRSRMVRISNAARVANGLPPLARDLPVPVPASASLAQALRAADDRLAALDRRAAETRVEIETLAKGIAATPANAVALARLEADHAALRAHYSKTQTDIAAAEAGIPPDGGPRLSLLEPATAPAMPNAPDPRLVMGISIGAGGLLGLALVAWLCLTRRTIDHPADLTRALGLSAFATLPYLPTPAQVLRRRLLLLGGASAVAAGCAVWLWGGYGAEGWIAVFAGHIPPGGG